MNQRGFALLKIFNLTTNENKIFKVASSYFGGQATPESAILCLIHEVLCPFYLLGKIGLHPNLSICV